MDSSIYRTRNPKHLATPDHLDPGAFVNVIEWMNPMDEFSVEETVLAIIRHLPHTQKQSNESS